jgi:hypothetical protein
MGSAFKGLILRKRWQELQALAFTKTERASVCALLLDERYICVQLRWSILKQKWQPAMCNFSLVCGTAAFLLQNLKSQGKR